MLETKQPPCRLFMIMAREAKTAVIFRRGPSKWTQLIKWNTKNDTFEYGQWFKGRIYEKRCDVSPNGELLIYFASKFNKKTVVDPEYTYAWTAISKPPWLTALALWPKGNCWHGGGLFESDTKVVLNHHSAAAQPHPKHQPPRHLRVSPNPNVRGEDDPLYSSRLTRDGWHLITEWQVEYKNYGYTTQQPEVRQMLHPNLPFSLVMKRTITRFKYAELYEILNQKTGERISLDNVVCARWDQRGRLAFMVEGKLFTGYITIDDKLVAKEIADFNENKPTEIDSPVWAKSW